MSKPFKRLAIVAGIGLGLLLLLVLAATLWVDSLAATAVRRGATAALGVDADVSKVDIGFGDAAIENLEIDNPQGFDSPFFLRLADASAEISLTSLLADTIRVRRVELSGLRAHLDQSGTASNYGAILDHVKSREAAGSEQGSDGKKFIIDQLVIRDIQVLVRAKLLPTAPSWTEVTVPVDRIELTNLGTGTGGGLKVDQLVGVVVKVVLSTVLENAGDQLPEGVAIALRAGLEPLQSLQQLGAQVAVQAAAVAQKKVQDAVQEALEDLLRKREQQTPTPRDPQPPKSPAPKAPQ